MCHFPETTLQITSFSGQSGHMPLQGGGGHKLQYAGCLVLVPVSGGFFAVVLHFCRPFINLLVSFCMAAGDPNATESEG